MKTCFKFTKTDKYEPHMTWFAWLNMHEHGWCVWNFDGCHQRWLLITNIRRLIHSYLHGPQVTVITLWYAKPPCENMNDIFLLWYLHMALLILSCYVVWSSCLHFNRGLLRGITVYVIDLPYVCLQEAGSDAVKLTIYTDSELFCFFIINMAYLRGRKISLTNRIGIRH